jgi:hypothetical protein
MSNIEREVLAAALLGYWGRPRNGQHGPVDWTPRQYEVMAEALKASGLPEQLRGAVSTLTSVRVWAEIVRDRHSDEHVRRHMRMLLGLLDGEDPDTYGGQ